MSEPGSGSDVVSMRTRADRKGDRFVLNGTKMWITNGPEAETLVVYAKTDPDAGPRGITAFLIEKGFAGFSTHQKLDKLGMRGSDTCELVFQDCEVPEENVLGEVGPGRGRADVRARLRARGAGGGAFGHHAGLPRRGAALRARAKAVRAADRDVPARPGQARRHVRDAERLQGLRVRGGEGCDRGQTTREDAAGAILYAAEKATQVALDAIQLLGGNGYINDYPTGRLLGTRSCTRSGRGRARSGGC
jgi:isovaleryl-CoA dehydrogenase